MCAPTGPSHAYALQAFVRSKTHAVDRSSIASRGPSGHASVETAVARMGSEGERGIARLRRPRLPHPLGTGDLRSASLPLALTPRNSCPELIYFLMLQQC